MADNLEDDELEGQPDARQFDVGAQSRIARPNSSSSLPPATLRGIGAPAPTAQPASGTEDMEANSLASHIAPPPIARPSAMTPIESRTQQDQNELARLERTGSGVSQLWGKAKNIQNPVLRGLGEVGAVGANVLDKAGTIAGNVYRPLRGITAAIPGTTAHHEALIGEQRGRIAEDLGEQKEQGGLGEIAARMIKEREEAGLHKAQAGEIGQPKPKEEKWSEFAGYTDNDGTPLIREENSGQVVRADNKQPATGFKPAAPKTEKSGTKITRMVNGVPHEVLVDSVSGEDIKDEGQTKLPGETPADKNAAQVERESRQNIRKAEGQYRDTQRTVTQLGASIDAAKDGNGLLTSFVPTMEVLGINASNGVHRISPAEAQAAGMPGSVVERFNAFFDKATTGKLTPELQSEGKQLAGILLQSAYQRYKSTYDDESGMVAGYGGKDFGKRVPLIPAEANGGGAGGTGGGGGELTPPKAADPGMKWQHRAGPNGQVEWRQVPAQ
jgi:hypothetical protein